MEAGQEMLDDIRDKFSLLPTVEARKLAYLSGHKGAGIEILCETGVSYEDAKAVIEGTKQARLVAGKPEKITYAIEDDDWKVPDFDRFCTKMIEILKEVEDAEPMFDSVECNVKNYYESFMALMLQGEVLRNGLATVDSFNYFMKILRRPKDIIVINVEWL